MSNMLPISAVILAGGRGQRMNGADKGLLTLNDKPMVQHVIERISPQVDELLLSANRHIDQYEQLGYPVVSDEQQGFQGPLAGIASAMARCHHSRLLIIPCDTPFLPTDLAQRMVQQLEGTQSDVCLAHDGLRLQPLVCLLKTSLLDDLRHSLTAGHLKVSRWMEKHRHCVTQFNDPESFRNINTPAELSDIAH